eukprot:TRINITY_DN7336_c0_g1_i2.p1 TRINITY_DN7336_c0_g1~~TRINITY_DN7336_c0_g1_i2.p1  ORF type:complete len:346 (+),score=158.54 TRINITY_DN7336_c0_g1_i2:30-1067(+)
MEDDGDFMGMDPEMLAEHVSNALSSPRATLFGGQLKKGEDLTWEPETLFHELSLTSIVLDPAAKGSCTVTVTVDETDEDGEETTSKSFVIAVLRPEAPQHSVNLQFSSSVVFGLSSGKGSVHLVGNVVIDRAGAEEMYAELVEADTMEMDDEDYEDDLEDDEDVTGPIIEEIDDEDEDEEDGEEEEAPALVETKGNKSAKRAAQPLIGSDDDDEEEDEELDLTMADEPDDEDDDEDDDDEDEEVAVAEEDDDDDDDEEEDDEDEDDEAPPSKMKKPVTASTPKAKKAKTETGEDKKVQAYLQQILKSPNKPKKEKKFKNYCKSTLKVTDEATLALLWSKYKASTE